MYENIDEYFILLTDKKLIWRRRFIRRVKNRTTALTMIKNCLQRNYQYEMFLKQYWAVQAVHP